MAFHGKGVSGNPAAEEPAMVLNLSELDPGNKLNQKKSPMATKFVYKDKNLPQQSSKAASRALRSVVCDWVDCGKTFTTMYALSAHHRTHTGQRPYICGQPGCTKAFRSSSDLQRHSRIHTGEKPYECAFHGCFKRFSTLAIRKVHMRTHTGERPYVCEYPDCTMTFSSLTNYKNHSRTHTGEKPYICKHAGCGKSFAEYSTMHKHRLVHVESAIVCGACGRRFRQSATYQAHRKREHGWMFAAEPESVQKVEETHPEPPRIQLLLTDLDVRTVEIDGAATSVLVLPSDADASEVSGGRDLQLLDCAEALVVSGESGGQQVLLQGRVDTGEQHTSGTDRLLVDGEVPLVLREEVLSETGHHTDHMPLSVADGQV